MQATPSARDSLRMAAVEEHVRHENRHDLDGLLSTFGGNAVYEDGPWGERHDGLGAVREYYEGLFRAAPDLHVDVKKRHVGDDAIVLEVVITGTHRGPWRGLPAYTLYSLQGAPDFPAFVETIAKQWLAAVE